eukprot:1193420-Prorocentrum_minimum.AAC.6
MTKFPQYAIVHLMAGLVSEGQGSSRVWEYFTRAYLPNHASTGSSADVRRPRERILLGGRACELHAGRARHGHEALVEPLRQWKT